MPVLLCEIHRGPLRHRPGEQRWICPGWDGEGCLNLPDGLSEDAYDRVNSYETYWPGLIHS